MSGIGTMPASRFCSAARIHRGPRQAPMELQAGVWLRHVRLQARVPAVGRLIAKTKRPTMAAFSAAVQSGFS
jgi:hypothetical protein